MSELDDFRPRIRNWARVYRTRFARQESTLMPFIRAVQQVNNHQSQARERNPMPNFQDAAFIDKCILELRNSSVLFARDYAVLKAEYLTGFSSETFENTCDAKKATKFRARYAQVFEFMYDEILNRLEMQLMRYVQKKESNPFEESHN